MKRWMMDQRRLFFLSFAVGVITGTLWSLGFVVSLTLTVLGLTFFLLHRFLYASHSLLLLPLAILTLGFALGAGRIAWVRQHEDHSLDHLIDQKVMLMGKIVDEPDERAQNTKLTFLPDTARAKILLTVGHYPTYHYGERLQIAGQLTVAENFLTSAGREFDYQNYLAKDDIYYLLNQPQVTILGQDEGWGTRVRGGLFVIKNFFLERLSQVLPEPHASLLGGLTIGAKHGLSADWQDRFRAVGLSHVVVLSGYNITIVAEAVAKVLVFLPPLASISFSALAVILFTLATGASTTAIRATLMALVALFARATGRIYQSLDALFLAAFLMVLFQPKILLSDISFQLSFLATLGVIIGPPRLEKYLRGMIATTISAQLFVLPWILYKMGQLSLVALPVNFLVLIFVPITMLLGFLTVIWSPFAYLSYLFLAYILFVVKVFSALPFAAVNLAYFPLPLVVLIYASYFYWLKLRPEK